MMMEMISLYRGDKKKMSVKKFNEMSDTVKEYVKTYDVFGVDDNDYVVDIENEIVDQCDIEDYIAYRQERKDEQELDEMKRWFPAYFDDLAGHIEMLEDEASLLDDCIKLDELNERIPYLKSRLAAGDIWIDNDVSASPDKWKTLETFTEAEAIVKYKVWNE